MNRKIAQADGASATRRTPLEVRLEVQLHRDLDGIRPAGAGVGSGALLPRPGSGSIGVKETGQVRTAVSIVTDIHQPGLRELALNVQAPLLHVGGFVIDGHAGSMVGMLSRRYLPLMVSLLPKV